MSRKSVIFYFVVGFTKNYTILCMCFVPILILENEKQHSWSIYFIDFL